MVGKTWFERSDACCNVAYEGVSHAESDCQVLTVSPRAVSGMRLDWQPINANQNQYVPDGAVTLGNDEFHGNLFSCRIRDSNGDFMSGQTWFPRDDGACCSVEYGSEEVHGSACELLVQTRC